MLISTPFILPGQVVKNAVNHIIIAYMDIRSLLNMTMCKTMPTISTPYGDIWTTISDLICFNTITRTGIRSNLAYLAIIRLRVIRNPVAADSISAGIREANPSPIVRIV
jgi:hypothetical protein